MELSLEIKEDETAVLFLNDCNGYYSSDPKADLVLVTNFNYDMVKQAEKSQIGVGRVGGKWTEALSLLKMNYRKILKGNESEFNREPFIDLIKYKYKVISGNY